MLRFLAGIRLVSAASPSAEISSLGHVITIADASSLNLSTADS